MSFIAEQKSATDLADYNSLDKSKESVEKQVVKWLQDLDTLHPTVDAAKQSELVAMKAAFQDDLNAFFAVSTAK